MAMKKAAKKSRRRLKRSVRRSLAAVLMITAIGVAAVPVPENYADNGDAAGSMSRASDIHDMKAFGYDADNADLVEAENAPVLNTYKDKTMEQLMDAVDAGKVDVSYAITDVGGGILDLSWQFMFYEVTDPRNNAKRGAICKYNNAYSAEKVNFSLHPNTEYFTVETDAFDKFYEGTAGTNNMDVNPTDKIEYIYNDYLGTTAMEPKVKDVFDKYFKTQYDAQSQIFEKYKNDKERWENDPNNTGSYPEPLPAPLSIVPADSLSPEQKLQYYCEHSKQLRNYGSGYTLRSVSDSRPGKMGSVYLAVGGQPAEGYYNDENGFLVTERSPYLMCAIGDGAFKGVSNVVNMEIPDMIGYIGDEAFQDAALIESINIVNAEHIGNNAFKGCFKLATVNLGQGTKTIGKECFSGTAIHEILIPSTVLKIGYGAFSNCKQLSKIDMNNIGGACEIGDYAFFDCSALVDVSMADSSIISIGEGAFAVESGSQPMGIKLPQNMSSKKSIGNYMFVGRAGLEYVIFPQNYGRTEANAAVVPNELFHGCANLQYVEFPSNYQTDPQACGFVKYTSEVLFADVINSDFYVKGPKNNTKGEPAEPRTSTWDATTAVSNKVPYVYIENGMEYYEVSDGTYLLCINNQGILTSCTFKPGLIESAKKNVELEIPALVGKTKVVGIATGCFRDTELNREVISLKISDDSISSIDNGVFQAGGGEDGKDWKKLRTVYIGNSVNSIGDNAFKDCSALIDVTFNSPLNGHEAFTIGTDAFKTQSEKLTFHGDIVEGYAPFEWAMDSDNIIQTQDGIRVCYKSLSPSYLTVMYNPITDMVTLLDYPKYSQVSDILQESHAHELSDKQTYEQMMVATWYERYSGEEYDRNRTSFATAWNNAATEEDRQALYSTDSYGPWINRKFCDEWYNWLTTTDTPSEGGEDMGFNTLTDWLFDPIVVQAADLPAISTPKPYYDIYKYNVVDNVASNDPYRAPTAEEQALVYATENITVPAGVDSIDVYGYINNLTVDGTLTEGMERNTGNYRTYLANNWVDEIRNMYNSTKGDDDVTAVIPGLFSGYYNDFNNTGDTSDREKFTRGNDLIKSVTLNSVKYLPDYAFDSCENLQWVVIGDALADIGKAPFRGCYKMTSVSNNEYYTTENGIIYSNNSDGSLTIEECLSARGNGVGEGIVGISSDPNFGSMSTIKPGAFEDCDSITSISFGMEDTAGLTVIPEDCFRNCDRLASVILPRTVNDVGRGAFVGSNALNTLTFYGKEVKISGSAFENSAENPKGNTLVRTYEDSAVVRYVNEYGKEYNLTLDNNRLGELWTVTFLDADHMMMSDLKDKDDNEIANPQYVVDGAYATVPQSPVHEGWTFEKWVGMNNAAIDDKITQDTIFYAQGYSNNGMVNGKYVIEFYDGIDGKKIGPTQYIEPGNEAIAPAPPSHDGYTFDKWSDDYTNIQANKSIVALYRAANSSGGSTNTSGNSSNTSGNSSNNRNPSGNTTSNRTTSSQTSSSTSTTSSSNASTSTTSSTGNTAMYAVTVIGGSGSGSYAVGAPVVITANAPAAGQVFSKWTTSSQGVSLASVSTTPTSFTMPANNVTITAEYTAGAPAAQAAATGSTNGGNGQNNTGNTGNTRVDITKPGISNKDLATANVNGATDNFVIKISETDEATKAVADALTNKYDSLDNILYYAMDISLYDSTGTTKITDTSGISVDITIPIPDALVAYGGNNMAGAVVNGNQLENLNENFTTINGVPCIRFTASHFSPYTIYVDTGNLTEGMLDTTPKTGDPIHPKWFLSLGLACLSIILFMKKDKRTKVKTA